MTTKPKPNVIARTVARLRGTLEPKPSRWSWLVKDVLLIRDLEPADLIDEVWRREPQTWTARRARERGYNLDVFDTRRR